jgi:hypothetical protein
MKPVKKLCKKCNTEMKRVTEVPLKYPKKFSGFTNVDSSATSITVIPEGTVISSSGAFPGTSQPFHSDRSYSPEEPEMKIAEYECPQCGWRDQIEI